MVNKDEYINAPKVCKRLQKIFQTFAYLQSLPESNMLMPKHYDKQWLGIVC